MLDGAATTIMLPIAPATTGHPRRHSPFRAVMLRLSSRSSGQFGDWRPEDKEKAINCEFKSTDHVHVIEKAASGIGCRSPCRAVTRRQIVQRSPAARDPAKLDVSGQNLKLTSIP